VTIPHGSPSVTVTLDGSVSSDPENDTLAYEWKEGSVVVGTTATLDLNVAAGTHLYTLKVTDPYGASSTDDVVVTVNSATNAAPTADAGPDQNLDSTVVKKVTLNGSASSDPDGDTLTYVWKENGVQIATGKSTSAWLDPGTHVVTLTVTDPYGASNTDDVQIVVDPRTPTRVTMSAISAQRGMAKQILAHLKTNKGQLLNKPLTYYVDGVAIGTALSEDPTGVVYTAPSTMTLSTHTLTVKFAGDLENQPSEASATLTIKK
jgi:hypothetical protein